MKPYFFLLAVISIISLSFVTNKIKVNSFKISAADSTPASITQTKVDSVWIGSGYGWTHHTYHWIPAHWEAINSKHAQKVLAKSSVKDTTTTKTLIVKSDSVTTQITTRDSTEIVTKDSTTSPKTAEGRVWVPGHREFIHNNWVWVAGYWKKATVAAK
jgi:hypothetical protein